MAEGKKRGGSTIGRLTSRMDGLQRRSMPGGGEVFSGEVATRALRALNARAMTVDRSVIVSESFSPSRAEDQALYAHEMHHVENSGGENGNHSARDSEEVAARAVERMVLHRFERGGMESHEASHATGPSGFGGVNGTGSDGNTPGANRGEGNPQAQAGYHTLRRQGLSHMAIVDRIAREVVQAVDASRDNKFDRGGDKKALF